ncbi:hypothetical protein ACU4HD_46420 [Cupriavidus basilensis]
MPRATRTLALKLDLPLHEMHSTRAQGNVTFVRNDVTLVPQAPAAHRCERRAHLYAEGHRFR